MILRLCSRYKIASQGDACDTMTFFVFGVFQGKISLLKKLPLELLSMVLKVIGYKTGDKIVAVVIACVPPQI